MTITLNSDYDVTLNTALLGYVGETNARPVSVEGLTVDGADRYVMTIDYGDDVTYEVDITGGQWTPTADILRSAQTVSCQICAKKLSGNEYILVKKSRIFRLRIGTAIGDTAIPSPSVAADALDRIDAIGRQAHADMQTAVTAAETATTAAENAEKSATDAEKSADTAEQAASRAETAKTAAETSATQADTARQDAETARQQAVKSQNDAKVSAAQASTAAQQTTADKNITAGYAKTAKTCADSTAADRQAAQEMAEQVTVDKATVAENAAKVAEDRTAAETAAQTAQAVADSLPEDYTTAVGKIAENTAEISAVKLTDKELQRRVNALYDLGNGITHKFGTDTDTAYAKAVPTGAKLMSVKSVGGRSIVFNQLVDSNIVIGETTRYSFNGQHLATNITDGLSLSDDLCTLLTIPVGHKVLLKIKFIAGNVGNKTVTIGGYHKTANTSWQCKIDLPRNTELAGKTLIAMDTTTDTAENIRFFLFNSTIPLLTNIDCYINYYDLTTMFGAGNEPNTVEEFEKIFPADYYPYNAGEVVRTGVTEVAVGDTAYPIPEAIKALPGYGWSAGTARNYVDYENKRYVQCVGKYTFTGNENWVASGDNQYYAVLKTPATKVSDMNNKSNCLMATIPTETVNSVYGGTKTGLGINFLNNVSYAYISADDYNNRVSKINGQDMYYELATPIVTDISSLIPDDFLRNIEVEAGGSVTFKGGNDSYRIPVPSEEEYIVKLSEIGGTT